MGLDFELSSAKSKRDPPMATGVGVVMGVGPGVVAMGELGAWS